VKTKVLLFILIPIVLSASSTAFSNVVRESFQVNYEDNMSKSYVSQEAYEEASERVDDIYQSTLTIMADKIEALLNSDPYSSNISTTEFSYYLPIYIYNSSIAHRNYEPIQVRTEGPCQIEYNYSKSSDETYTVSIAVDSLPSDFVIDLLYNTIHLSLTSGENSITIIETPPVISKRWYEFWK